MPEDVRKKGFTEIYRVLPSGGHLFILGAALPAKPRQRRSVQMHDVRELAPVLKEHSFTQIEMEKTQFRFMGTWMWFVRGTARKE